MKGVDWNRLETLFGEAVTLSTRERAVFVDEACGDDEDLRSELTRLLAAYDEAPDFLSSLAASLLPGADPEATAPLSDPFGLAGQTISHYRLDEYIGGGGMGIVYRGEDVRLRRIVALKFLPPVLSDDASLRQRFVREARAASVLDHPNICTVYDVDKSEDGRVFIAMAYCDGESLKRHIDRGALAVDDAVDYAVQIADGLAVAHARGIVHRDLKPANVMVTSSGRIKIVDFGVAKLEGGTQLTQTGATFGTAAYMSPEQIQGTKMDARADLWSLGVVLFEMLSGSRPFQAEFEQGVLHAVLHERAPSVKSLRPEVPDALSRLVSRCLEKDPADRYPDVKLLRSDLEVLRRAHFAASPPTVLSRYPLRRRTRQVLLTIGALCIAAALLVAAPTPRQALLDWMGVGALPDARRVAVLPFTTASDDADDRVFCDGLMEFITGQLARLERTERSAGTSLWILPASEVRRNDVTNVRHARELLGATLVLSGRYQVLGDRQLLTVDLINAETGLLLDTRTIRVSRANLLSLQVDAGLQLAEMLRTGGGAPARRALSTGATVSSVAFDYFVRGRAFLWRPDLEEYVDEAIRHFDLALAEDSLFAGAHAGLCEAYDRMRVHTKEARWSEAALESCDRALQLDPSLVSALVQKASVYSASGRYEQALREIQQALQLDPASSDAHGQMARILESENRPDEAEAAFKRAVELRHEDWLAHNALGMFYYRMQRYEEAVRVFEQIVVLIPDSYVGYLNLGGAFYRMARYDEAIRAWERVLKIKDYYGGRSNLASVYYDSGEYAKAARFYEEALAMDDRDYRVWGNLAGAYYWAPGERQRADSTFLRAAAMAEQHLAMDPNDGQTRVHLAGYLAGVGKDERANRLLDEALSQAPRDANVLSYAAKVFEQLGNRERALYWLEKSLKASAAPQSIIESSERDPWLVDLRRDMRYHELKRRHSNPP